MLVYARTLERVLNDSQAMHQQEANQSPRLPKHEHELLCVIPADVLRLLAELQTSLELFENGLRGLPMSFQLQQSSHIKGSHLLLTAVRQHLRWGGLKYAEIAKLVPDGMEDKNDSHIERVRHSVKKEPNARCVVPAKLDGKLDKKKRSRTKKPKAEATLPRHSSR